VAAVIVGALAVASCGPTAPSPQPVGSVAPSPPTSVAPTPSPPPATAGVVVVDPTLLGVLPADIDGQPLRSDAATAEEIAATEELAHDIEAIAVGLYVQPGSSTAPDGLAIVNVVRLRAGIFGDAWFRTWRTTYDEGACQIAGGVTPGTAESRIGDHDAFIGTCQAGAHTYHVHLAAPDRVISITAAGEGRIGEHVVAGLTE
jgi:hypothetical protein